jgi:hypothetical protein
MSAMLYSPSRRWPLRRSGRPAQTSFSAEIRAAKAFTAASSQRHRRAASRNRHSRCDEMTKSATCCKSDSSRHRSGWRGATRCESVALRTAVLDPAILNRLMSEFFSDDRGEGEGVTSWAAASGWSYRGGGDGVQQMIPVLEYDVGGDGSQVLEEPVCCATCDDCLAPGEDREHGGGMKPKGE